MCARGRRARIPFSSAVFLFVSLFYYILNESRNSRASAAVRQKETATAARNAAAPLSADRDKNKTPRTQSPAPAPAPALPPATVESKWLCAAVVAAKLAAAAKLIFAACARISRYSKPPICVKKAEDGWVGGKWKDEHKSRRRLYFFSGVHIQTRRGQQKKGEKKERETKKRTFFVKACVMTRNEIPFVMTVESAMPRDPSARAAYSRTRVFAQLKA